jgi:hypothetical protein
MQAEEYSLARLAGLAVTSNQNNSQAVVNVGGLALHATTLTDEQVQDNGFAGIHIALQEVSDPATSGSAHEISVRAAKKDGAAGQGVVQELQDLVAGNVVWALRLSANVGSYGVQGTVGLSDVVLAVLGAFAVVALQATGQVSSVDQVLVDALSQAELAQIAAVGSVQK